MNLEKLPKWARELFDAQEYKIKRLEEQVAALRKETPESNIYYKVGLFPTVKIYIPEPSVHFVKNNGTSVEVILHEDMIKVYSGDLKRLKIIPDASNCIIVDPD